MNLLLSYAHILKNRRWIPILELWASKGLPLMIDSGAFTAMKSGTPIDHASYIALAKLLQKSGGESTEFIQLDVIRDPARTRENLLREYTEGLRTIPVLTHNAPEEDFDDLNENFSRRVCVAGAVQNTAEWTIDRVGKCWIRAGGDTRIHALGFSSGWHPFRSKAYSYDSTSWIAALRYGACHVWDPLKGVVRFDYSDVVKSGDFKLMPKAVRNAYMASGITPKDFLGREGGRTSRSLISFLSSSSWIKWARKVELNNQRFFFAAVEPFMLTQLLLGTIHNNRLGVNWQALRPEIHALYDYFDAGNAAAVEPYLDRAIVAWKGYLANV